MSGLLSAANVLVGGGVGTVVTAAIGALRGRKLDSANYARVVADISRDVATDLRAENRDLKLEMAKMDGQLDRVRDEMIVFRAETAGCREENRILRHRIDIAIGLLNTAIPLLETAGAAAAADQMRTAMREWQ